MNKETKTIKKKKLVMYVYHCVLGACGGQMKISNILKMAAMNCRVDAGN